jgi:hypothetical protein
MDVLLGEINKKKYNITLVTETKKVGKGLTKTEDYTFLIYS